MIRHVFRRPMWRVARRRVPALVAATVAAHSQVFVRRASWVSRRRDVARIRSARRGVFRVAASSSPAGGYGGLSGLSALTGLSALAG